MNLAFLISGDYPELARAEIEYLLSVLNPKILGRVLVYQCYQSKLLERLALTREVVKVYALCSFYEVEERLKELADYLLLTLNGKCCVRVKYFSPASFSSTFKSSGVDYSRKCNLLLSGEERKELERKFGAILWRKGLKISVSSPDIVVRVYVFPDSSALIGLLLHRQNTKQFSERHPEKRPFFKPGVMLPKLCRAFVNISTASGSFLDPMCGTGGFVIEASLSGLNAAGVDLYPEVVKGCRANTEAFSPEAHVICGDATNLPFKHDVFDGVATDFPYYQSSKSLFSRETLHERVAEEVCRVLKPGKRAVFVTNVDTEFPPLKVIDTYRIRVHGSLTRRVYVLEKQI